jgi:LssY C-terminus
LRRPGWGRAAVVPAVLLAGCLCYRPEGIDTAALRARGHTKVQENIRVTVAVPSDEEAARLFGVPLAKHGIQPVWLRIENGADQPYWFTRLNLDPDYFTPLEAANRVRFAFDASANARMRQHFLDASIGSFVAPGQHLEGFVFTNIDRGVKGVNVDLIGRGRLVEFFFLVTLPGLHADYQVVRADSIYAPGDIRHLDEAELRKALEALPACATTTADGRGVEDPLNFVLIGSTDDVASNFVRTGWHVSEVLRGASALKSFWSYFFGGDYRHAPISPIYVFGRAQDLSLQKARETARERNHLRLWLTPLSFEGQPVWVGQISRDIGLSFTWKTLVGHEVDPDVDEARNYLVQDMLLSQGVARFGWVAGVGETPRSAPRYMDDGAPFFTDSLRAVMQFTAKQIGLDEVQFFGWETPPLR